MKAHIRIVLHELLGKNSPSSKKSKDQGARVTWVSHEKSKIIFVRISILYGISSQLQRRYISKECMKSVATLFQ